MLFNNKTIIVGVTGGIAAYKSADLVSKLKQLEADVWVIMTKEATKLVTPLTFRTLSNNPVITDLFDEELSKLHVPHISLAEKADLIIVAPATANMIGKISQGIADDPLTTIIMASKAQKLIAPAMNKNMWSNKIVQENVTKLRSLSFNFIGPDDGWLACGDEGTGRMSDIAEIVNKAGEMIKSGKDLSGIRILVTAGGTRESIDPVRFIGNRSSGKMGCSIVEEAINRGAVVTLVKGSTKINMPSNCKVIDVETARQMKEVVMLEARRSDVVIMAAAVADYAPSKMSKVKSKKNPSTPLGASNSKVIIELNRTDDILALLGKQKKNKVLIGFSLETNDLIKNSKKKMKEKNLDLVVANSDKAFDVDSSEIHFINKDGSVNKLGLIPKKQTANKILDFIVSKFKKPKPQKIEADVCRSNIS